MQRITRRYITSGGIDRENLDNLNSRCCFLDEDLIAAGGSPARRDAVVKASDDFTTTLPCKNIIHNMTQMYCCLMGCVGAHREAAHDICSDDGFLFSPRLLSKLF